MNDDTTKRHRGAPRPARRHARPRVLAQSRGAVRDAGVQGVPAPRVPAERVGMARPRRPPRLPEADGGVAGAGRRQRLHAPAERGARAVRAAARGAGAGQAAVLRHGDAVCTAPGIGLLVESHEGPADEDRGQPRPPVEPRRHRPLRAGRRSSASTIRTARTTITNLGEIRPFSAFFVGVARRCSRRSRPKKGAGLRILTETVASPTLAAQIDEILTRAARRRSGCSGSRSAATTPAKAAASPSASTSTRSTRSRRPTSSCRSMPTSCAPARRACGTRARSPRGAAPRATARSNRLYAVESTPTNTGTRADHRLPLKASEIEAFARAVAAQLGVAGAARRRAAAKPPAAWVAPLVADLQAARGRSLVIAGDGQPAVVHALAHAMNAALGNVGADGHLHADRRSAADRTSWPACASWSAR